VSNERTTLINDKRYKGGSWRDRAYWLAQLKEGIFHRIWLLTILVLDAAMSR
jgi:hypothetical protein